jgi:nitrogen fixation/metabolism regulation signal transduction histidine kinase
LKFRILPKKETCYFVYPFVAADQVHRDYATVVNFPTPFCVAYLLLMTVTIFISIFLAIRHSIRLCRKFLERLEGNNQ